MAGAQQRHRAFSKVADLCTDLLCADLCFPTGITLMHIFCHVTYLPPYLHVRCTASHNTRYPDVTNTPCLEMDNTNTGKLTLAKFDNYIGTYTLTLIRDAFKVGHLWTHTHPRTFLFPPRVHCSPGCFCITHTTDAPLFVKCRNVPLCSVCGHPSISPSRFLSLSVSSSLSLSHSLTHCVAGLWGMRMSMHVLDTL